MFERLCDIVRRMRHRRGFGVHSPLAFSMVNNVIRQDRHYTFYACHFLDTADERRMLRLINFMHPAHIEINPADQKAARVLLHCGNIEKDLGCTLFIDTLPGTDVASIIEMLDSDAASAIYCRAVTQHELDMLAVHFREGLIFTSGHYTIMLRREKMALQIYEV